MTIEVVISVLVAVSWQGKLGSHPGKLVLAAVSTATESPGENKAMNTLCYDKYIIIVKICVFPLSLSPQSWIYTL